MTAARRLRVVWVAIGAGAVLGAGAPRTAEDVLAGEPAEVHTALERDKLLIADDGGSNGEGTRSFVHAWVIFERPRDEVLARLREAERQPEYRPELDGVETVERFENGRVDEQRLRIVFTEFVYRLRYTEDPVTRRLEWRLDPRFDNDLKALEGFWELYPYRTRPRRTLGRFGSHVHVSPALPRFAQKALGRSAVVRYVRNTRLWIESGGTWRP